MVNKYYKLAFRTVFLICCLFFLFAELNVLSSFLTGTLLLFYIWLPITLIILIISIIKLVNSIQSLKNDLKLSKSQIFVEQNSNKLVAFLISLAIFMSLWYSAYQVYNTVQKSYHEILNTSYFTGYVETGNSKYNIGLMNIGKLFDDTDTTISKMVFIDDTNHQIIIEGCHIETNSALLTNLKYSLTKLKLMKDKNYIEKDNCIYFYEPGIYDGLIKYSKLIILAKGESGFVYAIVETSTPDVPIELEKSLNYCNELVS